MYFRKLIVYIILLTLPAISASTLGQGNDSLGTADHPLVSRYKGSFIDGQQVHDFSDYTLPLGPAVKNVSKSSNA